jgi:hypothetical protein
MLEYMGILACEIQRDEDVKPLRETFRRWLRIPDAVSYTGFSRAFLYRLLTEGMIESRSVKAKTGTKKGIRLVDRESIDKFILESGR